MKFKILPGTELFSKLTDLKKQMDEANKAAADCAVELGYKPEDVATSNRYLAGGIDGLRNYGGKPDGWRKVESCLYYPTVSKHRDLVKKLSDLPRIDNKVLNDILGWTFQVIDMGIYSRPAIAWGPKFILVGIPEKAKYKVLPDMIEILGSEYDMLLASLEPKKEKKKAHA